MVKHTQTIRQLIADELFECVWPFCEIGAYRLTLIWDVLLNGSLDVKLSDLKACNLIKKETPTQVFSRELCEYFKKSF